MPGTAHLSVPCLGLMIRLHYNRTSTPTIHWIVPILAGIPFGVGVAQILQSLTTYLMDTYGIYFASAIAATVVLRSTCGAVFPLFAPSMFNALGDEWAMSVFAGLSTLCMPIPLLFWVRDPSFLSVYPRRTNAENNLTEIRVVDQEAFQVRVQGIGLLACLRPKHRIFFAVGRDCL